MWEFRGILRKTVAEKVWKKNHGRKITVENSQQKNCGRNMVGVYL
jgi:hypothetical protein